MPARVTVVTLVLVASALAGCINLNGTAPAALPTGDGAFDPLRFEKVHAPEEIVERVEAFAALPSVDVKVIGESVEGRPLHRVVVGHGPFELWAVGRHHGNEPTGAEAILQVIPLLVDPNAAPGPDAPPILQALHEHRDLVLERVTLVAVPVANPDGAAAFIRENVNGQDLNRDYYAFSQPEPQVVRDAFWEVWPDACLDLHNEGEQEGFDYDAFVPIALMEPELEATLTASSWRAVYEVDAAGGFGGGPNENYRLGNDDVTHQVVNPTAVHPGTHDMFCSLRGAPGWTPEGAIPWAQGKPVDDPHPYAWSTRLHAVTLAHALLEAAGAYDGFTTPRVEKIPGTLGNLGASHLVDAPVPGTFTVQVVWWEEMPLDKNAVPVTVEVHDPSGRVHEPRRPHPDAFTATLRAPDAEPGTYRVNVKGPADLRYEVRTYLTPREPGILQVNRDADGLTITNLRAAPLTVILSDVVDASDAVDEAGFRPAPAFHAWQGTVASRTGLAWTLELDAGASTSLAYPTGVENPGPWRWTAVQRDGRVATGVEAARSTE